eukprot:scaffold8126_cov170-Amphora_coffeaeformis.AAC.16
MRNRKSAMDGNGNLSCARIHHGGGNLKKEEEYVAWRVRRVAHSFTKLNCVVIFATRRAMGHLFSSLPAHLVVGKNSVVFWYAKIGVVPTRITKATISTRPSSSSSCRTHPLLPSCTKTAYINYRGILGGKNLYNSGNDNE